MEALAEHQSGNGAGRSPQRDGLAAFLDQNDAGREARFGRAPGQPKTSFLTPLEFAGHKIKLAKMDSDPRRKPSTSAGSRQSRKPESEPEPASSKRVLTSCSHP